MKSVFIWAVKVDTGEVAGVRWGVEAVGVVEREIERRRGGIDLKWPIECTRAMPIGLGK